MQQTDFFNPFRMCRKQITGLLATCPKQISNLSEARCRPVSTFFLPLRGLFSVSDAPGWNVNISLFR